MSAKRFFSFTLVLVLTFSLVSYLGTNASKVKASGHLQDGTYLVKYDVSSHGNFPVAYMKVENSKITEFKYQEYLAISGEAKKPSNYDYEPTPKVINNLNQQFKNKSNLNKLNFDAVSGATHTKNNFKKAVKDLMTKAENGETYEPKYKDGTYTVKADEASHGWLGQIKIVIKQGTIVGADYDEVAVKASEGVEKGDEKTVDNYKYTESPKAMKAFEKQIINNDGAQNMNYDVVSGATHTKNRIVKLAKEALNKAKKIIDFSSPNLDVGAIFMLF